ncbi:hypothetical protein V7075_11635 [Neobacillus drentensis]|uniref:hypothetical protein n=1 Tax=Neobacillus drentensis TaxID=220684 RepID=UPI003000C482
MIHVDSDYKEILVVEHEDFFQGIQFTPMLIKLRTLNIAGLGDFVGIEPAVDQASRSQAVLKTPRTNCKLMETHGFNQYKMRQ